MSGGYTAVPDGAWEICYDSLRVTHAGKRWPEVLAVSHLRWLLGERRTGRMKARDFPTVRTLATIWTWDRDRTARFVADVAAWQDEGRRMSLDELRGDRDRGVNRQTTDGGLTSDRRRTDGGLTSDTDERPEVTTKPDGGLTATGQGTDGGLTPCASSPRGSTKPPCTEHDHAVGAAPASPPSPATTEPPCPPSRPSTNPEASTSTTTTSTTPGLFGTTATATATSSATTAPRSPTMPTADPAEGKPSTPKARGRRSTSGDKRAKPPRPGYHDAIAAWDEEFRAAIGADRYPWLFTGQHGDGGKVKQWLDAAGVTAEDPAAGVERIRQAIRGYLRAEKAGRVWPPGAPPDTGRFTKGLAGWLVTSSAGGTVHTLAPPANPRLSLLQSMAARIQESRNAK